MSEPGEILHGLDEAQRQAAEALHGPVGIIAGAGSGKTAVITRRIAFGVRSGVMDPATTVAMTFTTKAAGEMVRRLRDLGVSGVRVNTFHAAALRQVQHYWREVFDARPPSLVSNRKPLVEAAATSTGLSISEDTIRWAVQEIEWAKSRGIHPHDYPDVARRNRATEQIGVEQLGSIYAEYERHKDEQRSMDFDDVLLLMIALIDTYPEVARHVRASIAHITVDEYQDVSPIQQRLIDAWLGDNDNICVVGDPMQTIYSFAGADASFLTGFARRYPSARIIRLATTYRCAPTIVQSANAILHDAGSDFQLSAVRRTRGHVLLRPFASAEEEATEITERIARLLENGSAPEQIAVLTRMNSQLVTYRRCLEQRSIPTLEAGRSGFFQRPEVRQFLTLLRGATLAAPDAAGDVVEQVQSLLIGMGWRPAVDGGETTPFQQSMQRILRTVREFADTHDHPSLSSFGADFAVRAEFNDEPTVSAVTLASLHSAKGMEFPIVFLPSVNEGYLPHVAAETHDNVAEERRLFYVGVTRAQDRLYISWLTGQQRRSRYQPSRFLTPLTAEA